jgi:hypothetical protein
MIYALQFSMRKLTIAVVLVCALSAFAHYFGAAAAFWFTWFFGSAVLWVVSKYKGCRRLANAATVSIFMLIVAIVALAIAATSSYR